MSQQLLGSDPRDLIFKELRNKNEVVKSKAADDLRDLITHLSRGEAMETW
jgi:hypothetical protein